MSISRRTAIAVRTIGVTSAAGAIALGVAGTALACNINEFSASAACDNGKGGISVLDKDFSGTSVNITVLQGQTQVGSQENVVGSREGVTVDFPVAWQPSTQYVVHVVKTSGDFVGDTNVTTPSASCESTPVTTPPTTTPATTTPATAPATTPPADTPTPTTTSSAPAPAVSDTNAPSPAAGGTSNLAETGGGSNTGMIAGVAAVFVALGGGAVFMLRRRNPASRH